MIKLIVRGVRKLYYHIIKNFREVLTVSTEYGFFKIYTKDKIIGYSLFKDKKWEIDFPREVFSFLKEKRITQDKISLIDLGANIGITSIPFMKSGWIENSVAVEADADNFKLLSENIVLNNLSDRIFPMNCAVTESTTELVLEKSVSNFGDHRIKKTSKEGAYHEHLRDVVKVKGDTIPNLIKKTSIDMKDKSIVIWIDIQGHEGFCFRGNRLSQTTPLTGCANAPKHCPG